MHASTSQVTKDRMVRWGQHRQKWSETPLLKDRSGFRGAHLLGDRNIGRGVSITLWETAADATAMDTSGTYQQAFGLFARLFTAPPTREQFEILLEV